MSIVQVDGFEYLHSNDEMNNLHLLKLKFALHMQGTLGI